MPVLQTFGNASARGWKSFGSISNDFELIQTQVLSSTAASVTFNLSAGQQATYRHLHLRWTSRTDRANTADFSMLRLNGDTGANYSTHLLRGNGSTAASAVGGNTYIHIGDNTGATGSSNVFNVAVVDILDAFNTSKNKTVRSLSGVSDSATGNTWIQLNSAGWYNTSAISSLIVFPFYGANFVTGSRFSLYGVRG